MSGGMACEEDRVMREYRLRVRNRIQEDSPVAFANDDSQHAFVVIGELINSAEYTILLYCGKLSSSIYQKLLPQFREAIEQRHIDVRVLVDCASPDESGTSIFLQKKGCIKHKQSDLDRKFAHFLLVDGKRYRLETSSEKKRAVVRANALEIEKSRKNAEGMQSYFNKWWQEAEIVQTPAEHPSTSDRTQETSCDLSGRTISFTRAGS